MFVLTDDLSLTSYYDRFQTVILIKNQKQFVF